MNRSHDIETLVESFCMLADEVQGLIDRKTILEHKLRFAAEQFADKYAPAAPEIADTLANLQIPPDLHQHNHLHHPPPTPSAYNVPLPKRGQPAGCCSQHQIALLIRDGRRAAQQLSADTRTDTRTDTRVTDAGGDSSKDASSGTAITTVSVAMEQDFTVPGKNQGVLDCPFSAAKRQLQLQRQKALLEQENQQLHRTGGSVGKGVDGHVDAADVADAAADHDGAETANLVATAAPPLEQAGHDTDEPKTGAADLACGALGGDEGVLPSPQRPSFAGDGNGDGASVSASASASATRCPIRFLDQQSPEVVAHYVETHKHELPRSHAICLKRYNKSEEQIRKIDAKYGNLVNMISGLGQFHQPMLANAETAGVVGGGVGGGVDLGGGDMGATPEAELADRAALNRVSQERVQTWAHGVAGAAGAAGAANAYADDAGAEASGRRRRRRSVSFSQSRHSAAMSHGDASGSGNQGVVLGHHDPATTAPSDTDDADDTDTEADRERASHFDRPLKEVRLGESPSRPWGIAVPLSSLPHDAEAPPPPSPPAAPVRMANLVPPTAPASPVLPVSPAPPVRKCPFDHSKLGLTVPPPPGHLSVPPARAADGKGDGRGEADKEALLAPPTTTPVVPAASVTSAIPASPANAGQPILTPGAPSPVSPAFASFPPQTVPLSPAFVNFPPQAVPPSPAAATAASTTAAAAKPAAVLPSGPQMVFTGPVFIGYPMEQAMQFMQQYAASQGR